MNITEVVKEKYGQAALRVQSGGNSCCGGRAAVDGCCDPITSNLYDALETGAIPEEAVLAWATSCPVNAFPSAPTVAQNDVVGHETDSSSCELTVAGPLHCGDSSSRTTAASGRARSV